MDVYVDYSCEENSEPGRTKITVCDFDSTSVRDVKYAIQEAIQAPVCDQQLFYQGQRVTDDSVPHSRLYFREGDCFKVQFLAAADITGMRELLDVLKSTAQEIVQNLNRQLPVININEYSDSFSRFPDLTHRLTIACHAIQKLADSFFFPWKCVRSSSQRHFFVQEGGFDAFLEVFKFSRQLYMFENLKNDAFGNDSLLIPPIKHFNQSQLYLQNCCLIFLWNFGETTHDRKFLLSKNVLPLITEALALEPHPQGDTTDQRWIRLVNQSSIGCYTELVSCDSNVQEKLSKTPSLIDKLLFAIDRCKSKSAGYSLGSSQMASNTLLYCSFNMKSAQPLVDCGALDKMINITKKLLIDKDSDTPLRYYCCLFLARVRSAPLVTLDRDTCVVIDELIDMFLDIHVPEEISKWEKAVAYVWVTMVPLAHLAFTAGKIHLNDLKCDTAEIEDARVIGSIRPKIAKTEADGVCRADMRGARDSQRGCSLLSFDNRKEELSNHYTNWKRKTIESLSVTQDAPSPLPVNDTAEISSSGVKNCVMRNRRDPLTWPGSTSTQRLGIFSLVHMLSIKENQQLALAESLLPYLVCLSWHLKFDEREKLRNSLVNFHNLSAPPSLKVAAKSVLALVYGLDMVLSW